MSDLLHDVRQCFENMANIESETKIGPVSTFTMKPDEIPGMGAMRSHNEDRIKTALRRAYRHFAGVDLTLANNDECFDYTKERLGSLFSSLAIETFCDGIQMGQKNTHEVKMALFYGALEELFKSEQFQASSLTLALEITRDPDVMDFFTQYTIGSANALGHACGFAHGEGLSHKIWDLWLLAGTSMVTASYIAGHQLGEIWADREATTEMETTIEEETDDSSE